MLLNYVYSWTKPTFVIYVLYNPSCFFHLFFCECTFIFYHCIFFLPSFPRLITKFQPIALASRGIPEESPIVRAAQFAVPSNLNSELHRIDQQNLEDLNTNDDLDNRQDPAAHDEINRDSSTKQETSVSYRPLSLVEV